MDWDNIIVRTDVRSKQYLNHTFTLIIHIKYKVNSCDFFCLCIGTFKRSYNLYCLFIGTSYSYTVPYFHMSIFIYFYCYYKPDIFEFYIEDEVTHTICCWIFYRSFILDPNPVYFSIPYTLWFPFPDLPLPNLNSTIWKPHSFVRPNYVSRPWKLWYLILEFDIILLTNFLSFAKSCRHLVIVSGTQSSQWEQKKVRNYGNLNIFLH